MLRGYRWLDKNNGEMIIYLIASEVTFSFHCNGDLPDLGL